MPAGSLNWLALVSCDCCAQPVAIAAADSHVIVLWALRRDAVEAASAVLRDGAEHIVDADVTPFASSLDSVRWFGGICLDLAPGGKDAFVYCRILYSYRHSAARVSDLYFDAPEDEGGMPTLRDAQTNALEPQLLLFFTAASLV